MVAVIVVAMLARLLTRVFGQDAPTSPTLAAEPATAPLLGVIDARLTLRALCNEWHAHPVGAPPTEESLQRWRQRCNAVLTILREEAARESIAPRDGWTRMGTWDVAKGRSQRVTLEASAMVAPIGALAVQSKGARLLLENVAAWEHKDVQVPGDPTLLFLRADAPRWEIVVLARAVTAERITASVTTDAPEDGRIEVFALPADRLPATVRALGATRLVYDALANARLSDAADHAERALALLR